MLSRNLVVANFEKSCRLLLSNLSSPDPDPYNPLSH